MQETKFPVLPDFYDPYFYDLGVGDSDSDASGTLAYYQEKVGPPPAQIVEIGAGTGRIAVPLAALGHKVIALDRSERMLEALDAKRPLVGSVSGTLSLVCRPFGPRSVEPIADAVIAPDDFLLHLLGIDELSLFFRDLRTWLRAGGRFHTDIRHRDEAALQAVSQPPFRVSAFPLACDASIERKSSYIQVIYWEQFGARTRHLTTTCQYQIIDSFGEVAKTAIRILHQRIHTNAEISSAANAAGFRLSAHTDRNQSHLSPSRPIGGSYEFVV